MKKIVSLFLIVLLSAFFMNANAQTFLEENFNGTAFPTGWTKPDNADNWEISNTSIAGGSSGELLFNKLPSFYGKSRMMSSVIDLTGVTDLIINFLQRFDNSFGNHIIGIETTSDGGTTWNLAFQKTFSTNQGSEISEIITTPDVGSATFQFCIFYQGTSYNMNNWYFDNFKLLGRLENDATLTSLSALTTINDVLFDVPGDVNVNFTVRNTSPTVINSLEVRYQIDELPPVTETFSSLHIASLSKHDLAFNQPATLAAGTYTLKVEILKVNGVNDTYANNSILTKKLVIAEQLGNRRVCIESFSSSTCGPCVAPNNQMKILLANNEGKYGITKYQMNIPGNGDPYFTAEGGTRKTYYGVTAIPQMYWNSKNSMAVNQTTFDAALAEPAFIDISGDFAVAGNTINIAGQVDTYIPLTEAKMHIIVNERRTTENKTSNGESEFFHVMMKMLPDVQGTTINAQAGESVPFNFSFNMSSTHVEEMNDLEVHVFVQDNSTKYIFNSNFLDCTPPQLPENLEAETNVTNKSVNLSWEYPGTETVTFTVFFNGTKLQEGITETTYTHENVRAGEHTYAVFAVSGGCTSGIIETSITVCGKDPENLAGKMQNDIVVLTWEADYLNSYSFTVFFNGEKIAEDVKTKSYIHRNVPQGKHTYGVLAVMDGCTFNTVVTSMTVGVDEFGSPFKIYPNPANDHLFVEGDNMKEVRIYNSLGQMIKNVSATENTVMINTKDIRAGLYFIQIKTTFGMTTIEKIVIQN